MSEIASIIGVGEMRSLFGESVAVPAAVTVDRARLAEALRQAIAPMSIEQIVSLLTNPFMEIMEYVGLIQGGKCCQKTSLLFNPHRLEVATKSGTRTLAAALKEDAFYSGLA